MRRIVVALTAASLVLAGCSLLPAGPSASPPTDESSESTCPDLSAEDYVGGETTVADPQQLADSVRLGDLVDGTCAIGFESERLSGVVFHLFNPSEAEAAEFYERAETAAVSAGYLLDHTKLEFEPSYFGGFSDDGIKFFMTYYRDIDLSDGEFPPDVIEDLGLKNGDSLINGGIAIPPAG